jgi:hypothetical protein
LIIIDIRTRAPCRLPTAIVVADLALSEQPLFPNLLNRLPPLFRKLSSVAQKLSQLRNDPNPDSQSSI